MRDDDPLLLPADFPTLLFSGLYVIAVMVLGIAVVIARVLRAW